MNWLRRWTSSLITAADAAARRSVSPFEVAYTLFFVSGIVTVIYSLVVPGIAGRLGFLDGNDGVVFIASLAIMLMAVFQLSRIYFVLHHICDTSNSGVPEFMKLLESPWLDQDKFIKFSLALLIISAPKFNILDIFIDQHSLDVVRQSHGGFPEVYNIEKVNAVLWNGAGYCFALAICFYVLMMWDLNVFAHYLKSKSGSPSKSNAEEKFRDFFYIKAVKYDHLMSRGISGYLSTLKFWERLFGWLFSMSMVIFIIGWNLWWFLFGLFTLAIFSAVIFSQKERFANQIFLIFLSPLLDLVGIFAIWWHYLRSIGVSIFRSGEWLFRAFVRVLGF